MINNLVHIQHYALYFLLLFLLCCSLADFKLIRNHKESGQYDFLSSAHELTVT